MPLPSTPTQDDLANLYSAYLLAHSPLQNLQPTSAAGALGQANAAILSAFYQALNLQTPQAVLDGLYALFQFNALPATPSTVELTFSGAPGTYVPQSMLASTAGTATTPSISFQTTASGTVNASGTLTVLAQSVQTGSATQVGAGTIVRITSPMIGLTTVTNLQAATGGQDAESPSAQRQRFVQYLASLMGATVPALEYGLGPVTQSTVAKIGVVPPFSLTAFTDEGGAFTDISAQVQSPKGVPVAPFSTSPLVGDAFYLGCANFFTKIYFDISQAGAGWDLAWQYWSQTSGAWETLPTTLDQTSGGLTSGTVSWDIPSDWVPTSVNGQSAFWIRIAVNSTSYTTLPTYYQILPLTPPPGFTQIYVVPPTGTADSVTLSTLSTQLPDWVSASETGILAAAQTQALNLTVTVTPTLYGSGVLTTAFLVNALTQFMNNLAIGQSFSVSAATFALQSVYQGQAVASVNWSTPTLDVYVPVDTLLIPGNISVTINTI